MEPTPPQPQTPDTLTASQMWDIAGFLGNRHRDGRNGLLLPEDNANKVDNASFEWLVMNGRLKELFSVDLHPEHTDHPLFKLKDTSGAPVRIFLIAGEDREEDAIPKASLLHTKEGNPFVLVNEFYHRWTPEYVRTTMMAPDSTLDALPKPIDVLEQFRDQEGNSPAFGQIQRRFDEAMAFLQKLHAELPGQPSAQIRLDDGEERIVRVVNIATLSQSGRPYLILDGDQFREALQSDEKLAGFKGAMGHEYTHIQQDHVNAAAIASAHGKPDQIKAKEYIADIIGTSPVGSGDPVAYSLFLREQQDHAIGHFAQETGQKVTADSMTAEQLEHFRQWTRTKDPLHAPLEERIQVQERLAGLKQAYEANHIVVTHSDRVAQTNWMIQEIAKTLPREQREILEKMEPLPMENVQKNGAPVAAPAVSEPVRQR